MSDSPIILAKTAKLSDTFIREVLGAGGATDYFIRTLATLKPCAQLTAGNTPAILACSVAGLFFFSQRSA